MSMEGEAFEEFISRQAEEIRDGKLPRWMADHVDSIEAFAEQILFPTEEDRERARRALIGGDYPRAAPLLHIRCRRCGDRVATVETDDGRLFTLWKGRRFPGVPFPICPAHGRLPLDAAMAKERIRTARETGRVQTYRV